MTDIGIVTAHLDGDSKGFEDAIKRSSAALGQLKDEATTTASALGRTTSAAENATKGAANLGNLIADATEKKKQFTKQVGDLKSRVEPTAAALSGFASAFGGLSNRMGAVVGLGSNLLGVLGATSPLMAGVVALAGAGGLLAARFVDQREEAKRAAQALRDNYVNALNSATTAADKTAEAVRNVGKSAREIEINAVRAEIAVLEGGDRARVGMHGPLKVETRALPEPPVSEFTGFTSDLLRFSNQALDAQTGLVVEERTSNRLLDEKRRHLKELLALNEAEIKLAKERNSLSELTGDPTFGANKAMASLTVDQRIAVAESKTPTFVNDELLAANAAAAKAAREAAEAFDSLAHSVEMIALDDFAANALEGAVFDLEAGAAVAERALTRFSMTVEELALDRFLAEAPEGAVFDLEAGSAAKRSLTRKEIEEVNNATLSQISGVFSSPDVLTSAKGMFATALSSGMHPAAGMLATSIIDSMEQAAEDAARVLQTAMEIGTRNAGSLLSSSPSASRGFAAVQAGGGAFQQMMAVQAPFFMTPAALLNPTGIVGPTAVAGVAGASTLAAELVTLTKGFEKVGVALDVAMIPAINALEPFGEQLLMLAPIVGDAALATAKVTNAMMMQGGGSEVLFNTAKLSATGLVRVGQASVVVAMSLQQLNMAAAALTLGWANMVRSIDAQMGNPLKALGFDTEALFQESLANANAAGQMGTDLGTLMGDLQAIATDLTDMSSTDALGRGRDLYQYGLHVDTFGEAVREFTRSITNIPNVVRVAGLMNAVETGRASGPGQPVAVGAHPGDVIITGPVTVQARGTLDDLRHDAFRKQGRTKGLGPKRPRKN